MSVIIGILEGIGALLYYTWWLWAFLILWPLFESTWLFWRQEVFKEKIEYVLLELLIPREIKTSPMAMEQVLNAIHALRNAPGSIDEKWFDGEVTRSFSLEVVSSGGEVHFYVRTPSNHQAIVESAFFSYYPDIEIIPVDDYMERLPEDVAALGESGYDVWGTEMVLERSEAYPIKNYTEFENLDEEKQYDPMGVFIETLSKVKKEETMAVQIVIAPAAPSWRDEFVEEVEKLHVGKGGGGHHHGGGASLAVEFPHILPVFPVGAHDEHASEPSPKSPTAHQMDTLKAVEENLSRPGFKTIIRYIFLSPVEMMQDNFPRRAVLAAFNQYRALNLNGFKRNEKMTTKTKVWARPYLFPEKRLPYRKQRILHSYAKREMPPETWMGETLLSTFWNKDHSEEFFLNTRSLATIFHPPTHRVITAPHVKRVGSRKAGPPPGLPIFGDEKDIEQYQ